jgi:hypothetical protein
MVKILYILSIFLSLVSWPNMLSILDNILLMLEKNNSFVDWSVVNMLCKSNLSRMLSCLFPDIYSVVVISTLGNVVSMSPSIIGLPLFSYPYVSVF